MRQRLSSSISMSPLGSAPPGDAIKLCGELGNNQLIEAYSFPFSFLFEGGMERLGQPDNESAALFGRSALEQPLTIHTVREKLADLLVLLGLHELFTVRTGGVGPGNKAVDGIK